VEYTQATINFVAISKNGASFIKALSGRQHVYCGHVEDGEATSVPHVFACGMHKDSYGPDGYGVLNLVELAYGCRLQLAGSRPPRSSFMAAIGFDWPGYATGSYNGCHAKVASNVAKN